MSTQLPRLQAIDLQLGDRHLQIYQAAGLEDLVQAGVRSGDEPFWAYVWPSARALFEVVSEFSTLKGKRVIEVGCGPGAPGLAAAALGADVTLSDLRDEARALAQHNAKQNGLSVQCLAMDWDAPPSDLGTFDGILAADVLYGDGMMRGVLRFIRQHLAPDGIALIADPNRVMPGGVRGAARLVGLDTESVRLTEGRTLQGGVTLHRLQRRWSLLSPS